MAMYRIPMEEVQSVDHGDMVWTGEFDGDNYAVLACSQCSRRIGMRPGKNGLRIYDKSLFKQNEDGQIVVAKHRAFIHLGLFDIEDIEGRWGTVIAPDVFNQMEMDPNLAEQMSEFARSFKIEVSVKTSED